MRNLDQWLDQYSASHQNPRNKRIHYWCVPLIVVSTLALLWLVPTPLGNVNAGQVLIVLAMGFYGFLSTRLALAMLPFVVGIAAGITLYQAHAALPLWLPASLVWVTAWVMQFIGHRAEATRPSFFTDILFLLIGPLWLLAAALRRPGISNPDQASGK